MEISCHGEGIILQEKVLSDTWYRHMATWRIYGSIAFPPVERWTCRKQEGINDLIWAKDEINAKGAIHSLKGSVAKLMRPLEERI